MDFTQLDNLLGALEKLQSLRPPSPPVVVNGHLGVWRTVRHNRVFIEVTPGGAQGKVLIGPPSLVGNSLQDVSDETWAAMTPRATLKEFKNIDVADNGVETLKTAIKNATGEDDTRRDALRDLNEPLQLVPMARRTGFTDEEIKQALRGKLPNKPLSEAKAVKEPATAATTGPKLSVVGRNSIIGEPPRSETPQNLHSAPAPADVSDNKSSAGSDVSESVIDGALALIAQPATGENAKSKDRTKVVADRLDSMWPKVKDDLTARKIKSMAEGLRGGNYTLSEVSEKLREMRSNRNLLNERNTPSEAEITSMQDHNKIKEFIETFDAKVEEAVDRKLDEKTKEFTGESGKTIVDEAKQESSDLPQALQDLIEENKQLKNKANADVERALAEATRAREKAAKEREAAALERAKAQRARERAAEQRRAAMEALSASQKERLQVEAILGLLNDLKQSVKSQQVKLEIESVIKEVKSGSYNRGNLLIKLYRILQLILALIPGL